MIRHFPLKAGKMEEMKFIRPLFFCLAVLPAVPTFAAPKIGPELEITFPFNSETRDKFGSTLTGIGVGFGRVVPKAGGKFAPDILVAREEKDDNKLGFYGAGVQYRHTFSKEIKQDARFVPFYGVGLGVAYGKVELPDEGVDDSKIVPSGSLFLGSSIGKSGLVEARVRALPKVGGLNFTGLSLTIGARF